MPWPCTSAPPSLKHNGYRVLTSTSGYDGVNLLSAAVVDAVVIDFDLDLPQGPQVAAEIKRLRPRTRIILLSQGPELPEGALELVDGVVLIASEPESLLIALEKILPHPDQGGSCLESALRISSSGLPLL